ncbi:5-oxoprolinase subunit B/C family protein [Microbacterium pygmaeum]|uniref:Sensor histidine kinase inhibitor, KipI family n=1 Tax=Microbacterium pygmaeum TaxID=370764 RepID=A0A1G7TK78_9MICO|nr:5-oxoprolinase/urea amidolyase family protein [Microbacterium pygmaeum]SDG35736.1 sensor histidine kinase inhibitor, KipI family [Microbacterium pygmaeum]
MNGVRLLPMGERALLAEVRSLDAVLALHARLETSRIDGVVDLVPAARTVLIRVDPTTLTLAATRAWVQRNAEVLDTPVSGRAHQQVVDLDIAYDGPDLCDTAELLGIPVEELVRRHSTAEWTVAFTGFAPGFGYLVSPDWSFDVPRLDTPRTRVPAGAVGLAAGFTGAYPRETPGGWRLIGTTSARLFDPDAAAAASASLLAPGTPVRFRPRAPTPSGGPSSPPRDGAEPPQSRGGDEVSVSGAAPVRGIRIVEPGLSATVQDLGRPGVASLGVANSGALDRGALRIANRLLGNRENAAAIEVTMGGLRAVAERDVWFAIAGAWGPLRLADREVDPYQAHLWHAGEVLHVDWFAHGVRAYLALRGGVDARTVLGSKSTDVMAGLGPERLTAGMPIGVSGDAVRPIPATQLVPWGAPQDDEIELALAGGPRADWFESSASRTLFESTWIASNDSDRVGMRLDGPQLPRTRTRELPSEGMVVGALQVPPSGRPTILLADGPVTGGYPVIAVVSDASLDQLGQARPGTRIRFRHARPTA